MRKFEEISKPPVEAVQYLGHLAFSEYPDWLFKSSFQNTLKIIDGKLCFRQVLDQYQVISIGDWIIKSQYGLFYRSNLSFQSTYREIHEASTSS